MQCWDVGPPASCAVALGLENNRGSVPFFLGFARCRMEVKGEKGNLSLICSLLLVLSRVGSGVAITRTFIFPVSEVE